LGEGEHKKQSPKFVTVCPRRPELGVLKRAWGERGEKKESEKGPFEKKANR